MSEVASMQGHHKIIEILIMTSEIIAYIEDFAEVLDFPTASSCQNLSLEESERSRGLI